MGLIYIRINFKLRKLNKSIKIMTKPTFSRNDILLFELEIVVVNNCLTFFTYVFIKKLGRHYIDGIEL